MNLFSFSRLFAQLGQRRSERKAKRRGPRPIRPCLELLEDRTLLSSSPAAVVTNPNPAFAAGFDPQVAIDPTNSQNLVEVSTTGSSLVGEYSTNGGQTWGAFAISGTNLGNGTFSAAGTVLDPTTFDPNLNYGEDAYTVVTSPSVTFDRSGNFYIVSNQYNAAAQTLASSAADLASGTNVAGASGAIVFDEFNLNAAGPTEVFTFGTSGVSNQILYRWYGQDPAYNPTVAVDANLPASVTGGPSFTDPTTGDTQTDTMAVLINPSTGALSTASNAVPKGIYVGWNTNFTNPSGIGGASSRIMIAASGDGGTNFTTNQYADPSFFDSASYATTGVGSSPQILFTQGSPIAVTDTIAFSTPPITATAGQQSTPITIKATNAASNPLAGEVVFLSSSSGTGNFYSTTGAPLPTTAGGTPYVITANGTGQASFLYEDSTPGTPTITAVNAATSTVIALQTETISAGFGNTIAFTTSSMTVTAGQQTGTITILEKDAANNPVADELVYLTSGSGTGTFYSTTGAPLPTTAAGVPYVITNSTGHASFLYEDTSRGLQAITATDAANGESMSQTETVNAAAVTSITFTTIAASTAAGKQSGTITIMASKGGGGGGAVANEVVLLSSTSAAGSFAFFSTTGVALPTTAAGVPYVVTNGTGRASFLYEDNTPGTPTITATDSAKPFPFVMGQQTETVNAATAAAITYTTTATTSAAGQQTGTITILVQDASSNVVTNEVVYLSSDSGTGTFYSTAGVLLPTTTGGNPYVVTNGTGQASFLYEDATAGTPTITATDSASSVIGLQMETVNADIANTITFTTGATSTPAGKQSGAITILVQDSTPAPVPGEVVLLSSSSGTGTFYNSTTGAALPTTAGGVPYVVTNGSGHASFLYEDNTPGTPTITATDSANNTVLNTQMETVTAGASINFVTPVTTVTAGKQSGTITIQVTNENNIAVANEVVLLSSSSGGGTFYSTTGVALPTTTGGVPYVVTNASGQASFLYSDRNAGTPTITAADAASNGVTKTQTEMVTAGVANTITFTTSPMTATAGKQSGTITILVQDAGAAAVTNEVVFLRSNSVTGTFYSTSGVALPKTAGGTAYVITNGSGQASFLYEDSTQATPTITATDSAVNTATKTQTESIIAGAAATITFTTGAFTANPGLESATITIQVRNSSNAAVANEVVKLTSSSPNGIFFSSAGAIITSVVTNGSGQASFFYEDSAPGTPTLTATDSAVASATKTQMETITSIGVPTVPGGQMNVIYTDDAGNAVIQQSQPDGGLATQDVAAATTIQGETGNIADALPTPSGQSYNIPQTTTFTLNVTAADFPSDFTTIDDLEVTLDIVHPHMNQVSIVLTPPPGSSLAPITLLGNRNDQFGNTFNQGLPDLPNMGTLVTDVNNTNIVNNVGTVFDSDAPRGISDGTATTPWIGHFQPQNGSLNEVDGINPRGANAAQLLGTWTLSITDYLNDGTINGPFPYQEVTGFSFHFSSLISTTGFGTGADTTTGKTGDPNYTEHGSTQDVTLGALIGSPSNVYPTNASSSGTTAGGTPGTGPGVVAAIDNTLGSFSPYQGRIYIAYVSPVYEDIGGVSTLIPSDSNIELVHSDSDGASNSWNNTAQNPPTQVNDDTVADNFSEGNRAEFMPSIAVDPITGTVVIDYYDGRWDASDLRVANSISYSVDGGADFSTSAPMNVLTTATDGITGNTILVAPIPGNQGQAGTLGFGDRASLVVYDGDVMPFFGSNLNTTGVEVMTADVTIPSAPTVVSGDMGPVVNDFTYQPTVYSDSQGPVGSYAPITYNNVFATTANAPYPVGTRGLSQFVVTFDRPVDISTFTTSQIQVMYESATSTTKTPVPVASITALDALTAFGPDLVGLGVLATQFLITLMTPQFAVGTYSYAIGLPAVTPDGKLVSDDIRSVPTGIADNAGPTTTGTVSGSSATILLGTSLNTVFAVPTPINGVPFQAGYVSNTLPLIIPGPHVVSTSVVSAGTYNTTTTYNTNHVVLQGDQQNLSGQNNINISGNLDNIALSLAAGASTTTGQLLLPITDAFQIQQDSTDQIQVNLNLTGAVGEDLEIQLVAQDGNTVTLLNGTVASNTLAFNDFAPTGTVAPVTPLVRLVNDNTAGDWQLVITNMGASTAALTVRNWSLQLPHTTADNEALNSTATGLLVTFDRDMMTTGANTLTAAAVLQMIGPLGAITGPYTIINGPTLYSEGLIPLALENRVFEITFPSQNLNGTYTLNIAPSVEDTNGNAVDTNLNAGLDMLEGTNPANEVITATNYSATPGVSLPPTSGTSSVTSTISISDGFQIAQPTETFTLKNAITAGSGTLTVAATAFPFPATPFYVTIGTEVVEVTATNSSTNVWTIQRAQDGTVAAAHTAATNIIFTGNSIQVHLDIIPASGSSTLLSSDLQAQLISPTGTVIQLFTNVGQGDTPGNGFPESEQGFQNTILDDFATEPIQDAIPPFSSLNGAYNPQEPLSVLVGQNTAGTWKLVLTNTSGVSTDIGTLVSWSLTFPHETPDSGLGQGVGTGDSDEISASFRIFNEIPTSAAGSQQWTAVGPAADNNSANTGPVNAIAVDPSDPSGNTVYVASANGGLWKTTNFLTTNANGPTYIPLTNLGPTGSLNISSIAVFGRNNDPSQSVIYAITGNPNNVTIEGNAGNSNDNAAGIGLIVSYDGGQTWSVLDSSHNVYNSANGGTITAGQLNTDGNPLPESDTTALAAAPGDVTRDDLFVGLVGYQVTVDPTLLNGQIVVYAAFSNGVSIAGVANDNGGVYRSLDGGADWTLTGTTSGQATPLKSGNATSVVLAAGSANSNGNLEQLYAGFQGLGVYSTASATVAASLTQQPTHLYPVREDDDFNPPPQIPTTASTGPSATSGRIVLATPALTSSPVENSFYQGWVYAAAVNNTGSVSLYVSKDYGGDWTLIRLPEYVTVNGVPEAFGVNNSDNADINTLLGNPTGGVINLTLAVDPTNAEVVYLGGGGSNLLRIDISNLSDPYAMVGYNNIAPDASGATSVQVDTTGPATVPVTSTTFGVRDEPPNSGGPYPIETGATGTTNYYNLYRDPQNPFLHPTTLHLTGITNFNNQGTGALWGEIGNLRNNQNVSILSGSLDMRALVAITDPLTGETRLLVGDDNGIFTGSDQSVTAIQSNVGSAQEVTGSRNGNLQLAAMADSASQPGSLAANVAGALFYGDSQFSNGFPASTSNILDTGNLNWTGVNSNGSFLGNGEAFATDQTGTGQVYQDRWANTFNINQVPLVGTDFFEVTTPPSKGLNSRTSGLVNGTDPNWPGQGGFRFAVNPIDPAGLIISSPQSGDIYLSTDTGVQWQATANFTSAQSQALAFGAPDPADPSRGNDGFLYAGTTSGQIWVSITGGSTWTQTTGLDGSAVQQIVTDPTPGSYDAFAVTENGVYYMKIVLNSSGNIVTAAWTNVTGSLFNTTRPIFNNINDELPTLTKGNLTSIAVDWRFSVPTSNPAYAGTAPVLYVGGDGGVVRSEDGGTTWTNFPSVTDTWTLATAISSKTVTTLQVSNNGPTPPATPFTITIGGEEMTVTNAINTWTLASPLSSMATSLTVTAGGPTAPSTPFTITIDNEQLLISTVVGHVWTISQRGYDGTLAASHLANATVTNDTLWTVLRGQDGTTAATYAAGATATNNGDNAVQQGGLFPDMQVTSLQLVNGDVNTSTGLPDASTGGYNMLVASTYGQGDFAIRLDNSAVINDVVPQLSLAGPKVVSVSPTTTNGGTTLTGITITFNNPVDLQTLLAADIKVYDPNGPLLAVQSVTESSPTVYVVTFQQSDDTLGQYSVHIAKATDNSGDVMTPYSGSLLIPYTVSEAVFDFPGSGSGPGSGVYVYRSATGFQQIDQSNASLLEVNSNGEVVADFQNYGVWTYTDAAGWTQLTSTDATLLGIDAAGDVFANFTTAGSNGVKAGVDRYTVGIGWQRLGTANATVLTVDDAGDVFAEYPGAGFWKYTTATGFYQFNPADASLLAVDGNGDVLFVDFPNQGVFRYTTGTGYQSLHTPDASLLAVDVAGDAVAQLAGTLYRYTTVTGFKSLNAGNASQLALDAAGDTFAEFPGYGVWKNSAGVWTRLTLTGTVSLPAMDAHGDAFVAVAGSGIYRYTAAAGWTQLLTSTPTLMAVDADGDVVADFKNYGLYLYTQASGVFTKINTIDPSLLGIDDAGDVFADLGNGIYRFTTATGYTLLNGANTPVNGLNASLMAVDANGDVTADFSGRGVWRYTPTGGWTRLNAADVTLLTVDNVGDVFADFSGQGVFRYSLSNPGWASLHTGDASSLAADGAGDVVAEFPNYGVDVSVAGAFYFQSLTGTNASLVSNDVNGEVFVDFPGQGFFRYTLGGGFRLVTGTEGDASVLA